MTEFRLKTDERGSYTNWKDRPKEWGLDIPEDQPVGLVKLTDLYDEKETSSHTS